MTDAAIWIDPARMGGTPCLFGTRIDVATVVDVVWHHGVQYFLDDYDGDSRRNVLACCAWWARFDGGTKADSAQCKAWRAWAAEAWPLLRSSSAVLAENIPDPPMKPQRSEIRPPRTKAP